VPRRRCRRPGGGTSAGSSRLVGRSFDVSGLPDVGDSHRVVKRRPSARSAGRIGGPAPYRRGNRRRHRPLPWHDYPPRRLSLSGGFRSPNRLLLRHAPKPYHPWPLNRRVPPLTTKLRYSGENPNQESCFRAVADPSDDGRSGCRDSLAKANDCSKSRAEQPSMSAANDLLPKA
jgi:hypothetical protein